MRKSSCGFSRLWGFKTNQQAKMVVTKVITAIEQALLDHLGDDGFSIKLGSLGRFRIRHKPASVRKNPFTGQRVKVPAKRVVVPFWFPQVLRPPCQMR